MTVMRPTCALQRTNALAGSPLHRKNNRRRKEKLRGEKKYEGKL